MVSKREKIIIGVGLILIGVGVGGSYLVLPAWESLQKKQSEITALEGQNAGLEASINRLNAQKARFQDLSKLKTDIVVREFDPSSLQGGIKSMLDQVLDLSQKNGNDLISLKPWAAPALPVPEEEGKENSEEKPSATGQAGKEAEQAEEPPPVNIRNFGYELVVRGSYNSIMGFISAMREHKELVEINNIRMENETGEHREAVEGAGPNPFKPIKLTARLVLYLRPKG